jgi:phytoene synthase
MSLELYQSVCQKLSKKLTRNYSTSFSLGIRLIDKDFRWAVYSIYGLVRVADEIVDTFHDQDKEILLEEFKRDTYKAIENKLSVNPILHSFQEAARQFGIGKDLIDPFFDSMAMDLNLKSHNENGYEEYIYGSAEVVGLMCLKVFCNGNKAEYDRLTTPARKLGAAFQKVNFLRDIKSDFEDRGRTYFPEINFHHFGEAEKQMIVDDIKVDFLEAYKGICQLPLNCRFGVYTAYRYYIKLLERLEQQPVSNLKTARVRVPDYTKISLLLRAYFRFKTGAVNHA